MCFVEDILAFGTTVATHLNQPESGWLPWGPTVTEKPGPPPRADSRPPPAALKPHCVRGNLKDWGRGGALLRTEPQPKDSNPKTTLQGPAGLPSCGSAAVFLLRVENGFGQGILVGITPSSSRGVGKEPAHPSTVAAGSVPGI